jgi:thiamine biosynthesis lipoprotein
MDTYMTVSACGEGAEETLEQEVYRLDQLLAAVNGKGEIARLNKRGKATLSEETGALVERNLELYRETGGSFDIAVYLLMKAWVFTDEHYRIPGKEELAKLRQLTDASQIDYDASKRRAACWKAHSQEFDAIFMTDEDKLYVTAGIAQRFSSDKYKTAIITK